jgi:hypothetical protein
VQVNAEEVRTMGEPQKPEKGDDGQGDTEQQQQQQQAGPDNTNENEDEFSEEED